MSCLFCGSGRGTREHIIPEWISEILLDGTSEVTATEDPHGLTWPARRVFNATTKGFCGPCNNTFLGGIEGRAKTIMGPMLTPPWREETLDRGGLDVLATWAFKTALTNDPRTWRPQPDGYVERRIPAEAYEDFRRGGRPPPDARIWVAARDPQGRLVKATRISRRILGVPASHEILTGSVINFPVPEPTPCWITTICVGPMVFRVAAPFSSARLAVGPAPRGVGIIWPEVPDTLTWPVDRSVLSTDHVRMLEDIADLIGNGFAFPGDP